MSNGENISVQSPAPVKHAGLGIASFIISLIIGLAEFVLVIIAGVMQATTPGGINETAPVAIFLGMLLIGGIVVCLIGLGLGIAGVLQKDRKKIFGVLGLIFNGLIILGVLLLMVIGSTMK